jgi:VIT1/CCC1 family predicted Fe2+/Mn2+ transporter
MRDNQTGATAAPSEHTWEASRSPRDASTADLVKALSEQTSRLVRDEMRLAQAELKDKGKSAGIGAGMFGGAGMVTFLGVATLVAAAVLGLSEALPAWGAALIVAAALLLVGAGLALAGRARVRRAVPPKPEAAAHEIREDIDTVKRSAHR